MTLAIDISNNQGVVDLSYCGDVGVEIVVAKATEGYGFHDDYYFSNIEHARYYKLRVGAYHFARPSANTGALEAKFFLDEIAQGPPVDFLVLDLEDDRVAPRAGLAAFALDWFENVAEVFHGPIYLYTSYGYAMAHNLTNADALNGFRLWIASWSQSKPASIPGWPELGAWQFTDEGYVPGVGRVDQSIWYDPV